MVGLVTVHNFAKYRWLWCGDNTYNILKIPLHGGGAEAKRLGRGYINPAQYFEAVPESTWQFYIGGYQPAQKWLKDRKTRELSFDDILHYQRMIVALSETEKLMAEIDKVEIE